MVDNDETELAVGDLARVIEYHRIRILRSEYDQIAAASSAPETPGNPDSGTPRMCHQQGVETLPTSLPFSRPPQM